MMSQLTQKEQTYLKEAKGWENLCVQKYSMYANQAQDPELKQLFQQLADAERTHENTINSLLQNQGGSQMQ